jgi:protein-tyrosine phosphatase
MALVSRTAAALGARGEADGSCYSPSPSMRGFVDLHSHWVASVDDGARSVDEGLTLLEGLYDVGFSTVVATPHMRPGMFDNDRQALTTAFDAMAAPLAEARARGVGLPAVHLSSEHFLDDVVFQRLTRDEALPYPGGGAALVEFPSEAFPLRVAHRFFDLRRRSITPVLAHPERYRPVWDDDTCLDALLDAGAHLLLDVCSLVGKYGRAAQKAAEKLLEGDAYEAACSDAHRPADVEAVRAAIVRLEALVGDEESRRLLEHGPRRLLTLPRA